MKVVELRLTGVLASEFTPCKQVQLRVERGEEFLRGGGVPLLRYAHKRGNRALREALSRNLRMILAVHVDSFYPVRDQARRQVPEDWHPH